MSKGRYYLLASVIMVAIFSASSIPNLSLYDSSALSPAWKLWIKKHTIRLGTSGFFSYMISPHPDFILHKLGHVFGFGWLGMAGYLAAGKSIKWGIFVSAIFAGTDEWHQYFVAGRSSRFGDIVLDIFAATCFIFMLRMFECRRETEKIDP